MKYFFTWLRIVGLLLPFLYAHMTQGWKNKIKFSSQWKRDHAENIESNLLVEKRNYVGGKSNWRWFERKGNFLRCFTKNKETESVTEVKKNNCAINHELQFFSVSFCLLCTRYIHGKKFIRHIYKQFFVPSSSSHLHFRPYKNIFFYFSHVYDENFSFVENHLKEAV